MPLLTFFVPFGFRFRAQGREEDDLADRVDLAEDHGQPVDSDAQAAGGREAQDKIAEASAAIARLVRS